jgi:6-phospho-beta-glucosidase
MPNHKLTLIGGGGVRGPLFVETALARAEALGLSDLVLFDIDADKLRLLGGVSCALAAEYPEVSLHVTKSTEEAFEGADFVVSTIRPGGDDSRAVDERIALGHGVLGQETVGPGGFAMALRTIPAILRYAELLFERNPQAWLFNFTNPAGLVTQALHDEGYDRSIGICDSANLAQRAVAAHHQMNANDLRPEVFGLNHLSWVRAVRNTAGEDLLTPLLESHEFRQATLQRFFPPELLRLLGTWTNEYLYYYYFAEDALAAIRAETTRGEEVARRNSDLLAQLNAIDPDRDPARAVEAYRAYEAGRRSTYMHYAEPETEANGGSAPGERTLGEGTEGYAGVALDLIEALAGGPPRYTAANIPHAGCLPDLEPDDVAELSVVADTDGVRPVPIGHVPPLQAALMRQVKDYERLAAQAIRQRSTATAVSALMAHPLVMSFPRATALVNDYLHAHRDLVGSWQ